MYFRWINIRSPLLGTESIGMILQYFHPLLHGKLNLTDIREKNKEEKYEKQKSYENLIVEEWKQKKNPSHSGNSIEQEFILEFDFGGEQTNKKILIIKLKGNANKFIMK